MVLKIDKIKRINGHKYSYGFLSSILFFLILITPQVHNSELVNATITSKTIFFSKYILVILGVGTFLFFFSKIRIQKLKISKIDSILFLLICFIIINRYFIQIHYGFSLRFI